MSSRALAINGLWSLASHLLHRGSLMLSAVLLARGLPAEGFAAYSYFQITIVTLATYAALGFGVTASRFFAEIGHTSAEATPPIGTLIALSAAIAVLSFFAVLCVPSEWLSAGLGIQRWIIALGVGVTVAGVVPAGAVLGLEKFRQDTAISALSSLCSLSLATLAVAQRSPQIGMWSLLLSLSVQCLGQTIVVLRTTGLDIVIATLYWTGPVLRRIATFAGPMFAVSILSGSSTWVVGRLVLGASGAHEFALYSIGLQWFSVGLLLPGMVARVALPRIVRERRGDARQLVRQAVFLSLVPATALLFVGVLFGPRFMRWYGDGYASFGFIIPSFLALAMVNGPVNAVGNAIVARDGQHRWLQFCILWFLVLVVMLVLVVPSATAKWAAVSHMAASLLLLTLALSYGRRKKIV